MKRLLRKRGVQAGLGWVLWLNLALARRTTRWRHEGLDRIAPALISGQPAIGLFWHGRIPICLGLAQIWWKREGLRCLISPSGDGEFVAQALARARFPAIRASSARKGDAAKARAIVGAFRDAVTWVKSGGVLIVTPDGPRGPGEVIALGALQIARRTGAPIYLMGVSVSSAITLNTWDKLTFAWPFGRGATVWDGPFHVPADADEAALKALSESLSRRLSAVTRRADVLCGAAARPEVHGEERDYGRSEGLPG
ncbi:lysophospholipid acyltransferase family protein [soil metagenome]